MPKKPKSYSAYRALLRLYPKAHREEYGEQMAQTFNDLLNESPTKHHAIAMWLRVGRELPLNIVQEHINNWEGKNVSKIIFGKRTLIGASAVTVVSIGVAVVLVLHSGKDYGATTYAALQRPTNRPVCLQPHENTALKVSATDNTTIGNTVATSISDALAGTNVDVYLKTYDGKNATGTAVYGGKYGNYNFVIKKIAAQTGNTFTGGWKVTQFKACKG
ncbi:MAG TPA: hypothetical protein VLE99_01675 [Candidatus Saccharimonadales bacterium]|nr:hypothetical protein [Candidatus Saccharimonadales bacterium]